MLHRKGKGNVLHVRFHVRVNLALAEHHAAVVLRRLAHLGRLLLPVEHHADSAAAIWCNGVYIGYSEETFTPAEFDMTAAVHPGENTLTVQVYRFSSGSWLEDQDFWRMIGLFRSVELFTKPEIHLEDVFVKQDFAPDFSRRRCPHRSAAGSSLPSFPAG